jgi:hypothetical protein
MKRERGSEFSSLIVEHVMIGVLMVQGHTSFAGHIEGRRVHVLILEVLDTLVSREKRSFLTL